MCVFEVACLEPSSSSRDSHTLRSLYDAFALVTSSAGDCGSLSSLKELDGSCVCDGWAAAETGGSASGRDCSGTKFLSYYYSCECDSNATLSESIWVGSVDTFGSSSDLYALLYWLLTSVRPCVGLITMMSSCSSSTSYAFWWSELSRDSPVNFAFLTYYCFFLIGLLLLGAIARAICTGLSPLGFFSWLARP